MKIKKMILLVISIFILTGCVNLESVNYDEIINELSHSPKNANTFKNGYQFYKPKGLGIKDAGLNYVIFTSDKIDYYLYIDLISYNAKNNLNYKINNNAMYSKVLSNGNLKGYIEINLWENNKYLIEIMYNYAKIEVMVDEGLIKKALVNSISILNSVKYDDIIIESLLNDDNLDYTEEIFDMFKKDNSNSNTLDYVEEEDYEVTEDEILDTDYVN